MAIRSYAQLPLISPKITNRQSKRMLYNKGNESVLSYRDMLEEESRSYNSNKNNVSQSMVKGGETARVMPKVEIVSDDKINSIAMMYLDKISTYSSENVENNKGMKGTGYCSKYQGNLDAASINGTQITTTIFLTDENGMNHSFPIVLTKESGNSSEGTTWKAELAGVVYSGPSHPLYELIRNNKSLQNIQMEPVEIKFNEYGQLKSASESRLSFNIDGKEYSANIDFSGTTCYAAMNTIHSVTDAVEKVKPQTDDIEPKKSAILLGGNVNLDTVNGGKIGFSIGTRDSNGNLVPITVVMEKICNGDDKESLWATSILGDSSNVKPITYDANNNPVVYGNKDVAVEMANGETTNVSYNGTIVGFNQKGECSIFGNEWVYVTFPDGTKEQIRLDFSRVTSVSGESNIRNSISLKNKNKENDIQIVNIEKKIEEEEPIKKEELVEENKPITDKNNKITRELSIDELLNLENNSEINAERKQSVINEFTETDVSKIFDEFNIRNVTHGKTFMYAEGNDKSEILMEIPAGILVKTLDLDKSDVRGVWNWRKIEYNGLVGWCQEQMLRSYMPVDDVKGIISDDKELVLYNKPFNEYDDDVFDVTPYLYKSSIVGNVNAMKGEEFIVHNIGQSGWAEITYKGVRGWCKKAGEIVIDRSQYKDFSFNNQEKLNSDKLKMAVVNGAICLKLDPFSKIGDDRIDIYPQSVVNLLQVVDSTPFAVGGGGLKYAQIECDGIVGWCTLNSLTAISSTVLEMGEDGREVNFIRSEHTSSGDFAYVYYQENGEDIIERVELDKLYPPKQKDDIEINNDNNNKIEINSTVSIIDRVPSDMYDFIYAERISTIPKGSQVTLLQTVETSNGRWSQIEFDGKTGWCDSAYLLSPDDYMKYLARKLGENIESDNIEDDVKTAPEQDRTPKIKKVESNKERTFVVDPGYKQEGYLVDGGGAFVYNMKVTEDGSMSFDLYNTQNVQTVVEYYDEDGKMIGAERLDPLSHIITSFKKFIDEGIKLADNISKNGIFESPITDDYNSTHKTISAPKGTKKILVTNNVNNSLYGVVSNFIDKTFALTKLIKSTVGIAKNYKEIKDSEYDYSRFVLGKAREKITTEVVNSLKENETLLNAMYEGGKNFLEVLAEDDFQALNSTLNNVDAEKIIQDCFVDNALNNALGIAETVAMEILDGIAKNNPGIFGINAMFTLGDGLDYLSGLLTNKKLENVRPMVFEVN